MILSRIKPLANFIFGMFVIVTMSISRSQDTSAVQVDVDTAKPVKDIAVKPSQQKTLKAQRDTINVLLEKITESPAIPDQNVTKTRKNVTAAAVKLDASDKVIGRAIDALVPRTLRFNKLYLIDIDAAKPVKPKELQVCPSPIDSIPVDAPEPPRPGLFKRIFRKF